ncbi:MAG: hypothetical protein IJG87_06375 [Ruminococcus sp.]|nr:hypothetical protein [Ruminococcus sp.]
MDEKLETLHELCETLSRELEDVNEKIRSAGGGMSAGDLELVDKLSHAMKSIKTTIAMMEAEDDGGYSGRPYYYDGRSYADGNMGGNMSRRGGRSYARGRGRNAKRDSMGRYSREGGYSYADNMDSLLEEMRGMMTSLPEEKRRKAERLIDELSM